MSTRANRFAGPVAAAGGTGTVLFTVPTNHRYLVRLLRIVNLSASTTVTTMTFYIGASSGGLAVSRFSAIAVSSMVTDDAWFVVDEGEDLVVVRSGGSSGVVMVTVAGYDLLL